MRISKLFRKYSRVLILVTMSLLLVVFLIGDVISRAARARSGQNVELGRAFGEKITTRDLQRVRSDLDLLEGRLRLPLLPIRADNQRDRMLAEFLLFDEVRHLGMRADRARVLELLSARGISNEYLAQVRNDTRRSLRSIYELVGDWLSILQAEQLQMEALGDSLPRAALAFRDREQQAEVELSVIESRAFLPQVPQPSEQELREYFAQAKGRRTAHSEDELVFGYRRPDRVQLEYLTVDPQQIAPRVRVREKEARRYYEEHRQQYVQRVPRPTTAPNRPQVDQVQLTYQEVRQQVRADCRAAKAIEEAQRLVNQMQAEAQRPWLAMPRGPDGFREPPPPGGIVSFEALRDKYSQPYTVILEKTGLLDEQAIRRIPGFGQAGYRLRQTGQRVRAARLALRVKGLVQPGRDDQLAVLNLYEPSRVLIRLRWEPDSRRQVPYQAYFFRVVRVVPSGPPDSLEQVRDQLVEDLKLLKAHELAGRYARRLAGEARRQGLAAALAGAAELKRLLGQSEAWARTRPVAERGPIGYLRYLGPFAPRRFTRTPGAVQYVGVSPKLHKAVFALAAGQTSTGPAHRVALVGIAARQKWVVAELKRVKPIYAGQFQKRLVGLVDSSRYQAAVRLRQQWYDAQSIFKRTGFVPAAAEQE